MNWILVLVFISLTSLSSSVPIYEQCGGVGYTGPTQCNWPLRCFHRSQWYAQCRADCPTDWLCQDSTSGSTEKYIPPTMNITGFATSGPIAVQKRSLAVDNKNTETMFGHFVIAQMLGSDSVYPDMNSFQLSENVTLLRIIGDCICEIAEEEDMVMMRRLINTLRSDDLNEKFKALAEMSERLERIVTSSKLAEALKQQPLFIEQHARASLENVGDSGSAMQTDKDPCNGPIPDIGKENGLYGSESRLGMTAEISAGLHALTQDPKVNAIQLTAIDYGFGGKPTPESRLGAYYVTRGYKFGSVGSAVHRIIGGMYLALGSAGEEKIGRIYNNQAVKALFNQPIESAAIRCLAYIEQLYFTNVKKENPESMGAALGAVITPRARDCLTKLVSGVFCS